MDSELWIPHSRAGHYTLALALLAALFVTQSAAAQTAPPKPQPESGEDLPVPGRPVPADHGKLSEHNIEWVQTQPPQEQMEFLLGAAVNHDVGATKMIAEMVGGWFGKLHDTPRWETLQDTALYSNDLRVRAAAIEINLALRHIEKTDEEADRLIGPRTNLRQTVLILPGSWGCSRIAGSRPSASTNCWNSGFTILISKRVFGRIQWKRFVDSKGLHAKLLQRNSTFSTEVTGRFMWP